MKPLFRSLPLLPALFAFAAAGCGGGDHDGSTSRTSLTFATTQGYNGASADLRGTPTSGLTGGNTVTVTLTDGSRTIDASVPLNTIAEGQSVAATDAGVDVRYTETVAGSANLRRWRATAGTITYTRIGGGTLDVRVEGLAFTPVTEDAGDEAAGTFTADGRIVRVPFA